MLNVAHEHRKFMENIVQQLLASTPYNKYNAWHEFTLLLLPLLSRKLRRTVPSLTAHPPVLAYTIYQALSFDSALREEGFELTGTSAVLAGEDKADSKWDGISEVILGKKEWFEAWMEGERQCRCCLPFHVIRGSHISSFSCYGSVHGYYQCFGCMAGCRRRRGRRGRWEGASTTEVNQLCTKSESTRGASNRYARR